jgi:hypothetical protein
VNFVEFDVGRHKQQRTLVEYSRRLKSAFPKMPSHAIFVVPAASAWFFEQSMKEAEVAHVASRLRDSRRAIQDRGKFLSGCGGARRSAEKSSKALVRQ